MDAVVDERLHDGPDLALEPVPLPGRVGARVHVRLLGPLRQEPPHRQARRHVDRWVSDADTNRFEMNTSRVKGSMCAIVRCLNEMCLCGFLDRFSFLYV